jgi:enoyl-CoA hydratase/carnithine racemase
MELNTGWGMDEIQYFSDSVISRVDGICVKDGLEVCSIAASRVSTGKRTGTGS